MAKTWSISNDLNTARLGLAGCGVQDDALSFGGCGTQTEGLCFGGTSNGM